MNTFENFNLSKPLQSAIADLGFDTMTPIQAEAFSVILSGKDVVGIAQTGTGKTLAFGVPLPHVGLGMIHVLGMPALAKPEGTGHRAQARPANSPALRLHQLRDRASPSACPHRRTAPLARSHPGPN